MLIAMHMPDHILSPEVSIGTAIATLAACACAWRRQVAGAATVDDSSNSSAASPAMMGVVAALVFAGQMVNFAIPGLGASGHFLGAATAALLLGPWRGAATIGLVLVVQCLVFGDGGITALGANFWNMAVVGVGSAWCVRRWMKRFETTPSSQMATAAAAGTVSVVAAAISCAIELAMSGAEAAVVPLLQYHALIGAAEGLLTVAVVALFEAARAPALSRRRLWICGSAALLVAAVLSPLATALPDGLEAALQTAGIVESVGYYSAPLADYALPVSWSLSDSAAAVIVALSGTLGMFVVTVPTARLLAALRQRHELA